MVNLDYTLFIQMVNFIVLVILMNFLIFKPILKILDERRGNIDGAMAEARRLMEEAERLMEEYNKKVLEVRQQALQIVNEGRVQAVEEQRKALAKAREEAEAQIKTLRERIEHEQEEASTALKRMVQALSISIAERLLGRAIGAKEDAKWES